MSTIAPQFTQRFYFWTAWKLAQAERNGIYQHDLDNINPAVYTIWFYDGPEAHITNIWINKVPDGVIAGGYSQAQNDVDKADFEDNFINLSNQNIAGSVASTKSLGNSTVSLLASNAIFIGSSESVSDIVSIDITVITDQISAVNGLLLQWSQDNIIFDYTESFTVLPNKGQFFSFAPRAKYFRLTYTNGLINQTNFNLSVVYYAVNRSTYSQNLSTDIPNEKSANVVRAVLAAQKIGVVGDYTNLQATSSGLLKVSLDTSIFPSATSAVVVQTHNTGPTFATSISTIFTSNVHVNNTIIVVVIQGQGTFNNTYTLSDSFSNVYSKAAGTHNITPSGSSIDIWYAISNIAGICTVVANNFLSSTHLAIQVYEVSNIFQSSPVDKIAASASLGTSLSVGPVVTGANGEFCVAAYGTDITSVITPGSGWTSDLSIAGFGCFSQVQSTAGSITGTATAASSVNSINVIATFLPAVIVKPIQTDQNGRLITKSQLQSDDGYSIILGQNTMASSLPVVIALNQSNIPISGIVTSNIGTTGGLALNATLAKLTIAQNTALGANTQALIGGSVTTAAPTYTTGQISPISLTTAGAIRVDGSGVTQPVSGTVTANIGTTNGLALDATLSAQSIVDNAAFTDGTTRIQPAGYILNEVAGTALTENDGAAARIDSKRAQINVLEDATTRGTRNTIKAASTAAVAADTALVVAISPNNTLNAGAIDVTGTGTLNALNTTAQVAVQSESNAGMQLLAGTLVGTIVPEVSYDGATTWVAGFFDDPTTGNKVSSIVFGASNTATTRTIVGVGGTSHVRVRVSAFTSGTATCNLRASVFNRTSLLSEGAFTAATQPPDAIQISGWDGYNLRVPAVKASSTSPLVTDQALVVVLSPNQLSIPVTTTPATSTPGIAVGYINTSATTNVALRATTYTEQSANFTGSVSSSSANDTSVGTGARTLKITFVDSTGATAGIESVTLNGTTAVNLVTTTKCFIEKIEVITVGSTGNNVGTISLFTGAAGAGTLVGTIAATDNRTFWAHHYIVTNKTANITGMTGINNNSSNNTVFTLQAITVPVANQVSEQVSDWITGGLVNQTLRIYSSLIKVAGPARITMFATPGGTPNIKSQGSFDFYDA